MVQKSSIKSLPSSKPLNPWVLFGSIWFTCFVKTTVLNFRSNEHFLAASYSSSASSVNTSSYLLNVTELTDVRVDYVMLFPSISHVASSLLSFTLSARDPGVVLHKCSSTQRSSAFWSIYYCSSSFFRIFASNAVLLLNKNNLESSNSSISSCCLLPIVEPGRQFLS